MMQQLQTIKVLQEGEVIKGRVLSLGKNEVYVDIEGRGIGVVRGRELYDDEQLLSKLQVGGEVYASVMEIENREGNVELSLRKAGQDRIWQSLREKLESREIIRSKILEANKGGLMVKINNVVGFLPVSQLAPSHYPRVEDGDKNQILAVLRGYVGQDFEVRIITVEPDEEKLIVSERAVIEDELLQKINKFSVGQVVEGEVTGVVEFGAFVKFGDHFDLAQGRPVVRDPEREQGRMGEDLEGLVHISELAWQRIDDPKAIVKVGDKVRAQIIAIEGDRISLSLKRLQKDPWEDAVKKYTVGQVVKGKVVKLATFGAFVELDPDIQGLAHIGELSEQEISDPSEVLQEGEEREFKIISIEPGEHRLGLSIKALGQEPKNQETEELKNKEEQTENSPAPESQAEEKPKEEPVEQPVETKEK